MTIEHISSRTNFKPSDSSAAYNEVAEEAFKLCLPYAEKRFTNGNKQSKAPKSAGENDCEKFVNTYLMSQVYGPGLVPTIRFLQIS